MLVRCVACVESCKLICGHIDDRLKTFTSYIYSNSLIYVNIPGFISFWSWLEAVIKFSTPSVTFWVFWLVHSTPVISSYSKSRYIEKRNVKRAKLPDKNSWDTSSETRLWGSFTPLSPPRLSIANVPAPSYKPFTFAFKRAIRSYAICG